MSDPEEEYPDLKTLRIRAEQDAREKADQARRVAAIAKGMVPPSFGDMGIMVPELLQGIEVPERSWCAPGWIPDFSVTSLYGDGGTGKSLAAQMLMTAAALGKPWFGVPVDSRRSIGLFCEDSPDELHRRQVDINRVFGCDFRDLGNMKWLSRVGYENALVEFSHMEPFIRPSLLYDGLLAAAEEWSARLIVIDTAAQVFPGNENDRYQVERFVSQFLGNLARGIGGAVVLCAHPSQAGLRDGHKLSGSTAWNNAVRSRLTLSRDDGEDTDPDVRVLSRAKSNYASMDGEVRLRWQDGAFLVDQEFTGFVGSLEKRSMEQKVLDCLKALLARGLKPGYKPEARGQYAPKMMKGRREVDGMTYRQIEGTFRCLMSTDRLDIRKTDDRSSRAREYVVPASDGLFEGPEL